MRIDICTLAFKLQPRIPGRIEATTLIGLGHDKINKLLNGISRS